MSSLKGTAPPRRTVTDQEVRDNERLVHSVLQRMSRKGQLALSVDYDDHIQAGMIGLWEALRRWDPARGALSTYCTPYIWGFVMRHQRAATRATGYSYSAGGFLAKVVSYEAELRDRPALRETLPGLADTAEQAHSLVRLRRLAEQLDELREPLQTIARRCIIGEDPQPDVAADLGVTKQAVSLQVRRLRRLLAEGDDLPDTMRAAA